MYRCLFKMAYLRAYVPTGSGNQRTAGHLCNGNRKRILALSLYSGNIWKPQSIGRSRGSFLGFSVDTKQTRVLRYIRTRENERNRQGKNPFSRVQMKARTICQNLPSLVKDLTYSVPKLSPIYDHRSESCVSTRSPTILPR